VDGEGHSLKLLNSNTHFRALLEAGLGKRGVENYLVLNGVAGLLGFSPNEKQPPNSDLVMDLKPVFHKDSDVGSRNLAKTTVDSWRR
jgi:hypothetical protein